jgi:membrane protease YdiL (CAAX protease family)
MASRFRTALLVAFLAGAALLPAGPPSLWATLLVQWLLFGYVAWADRRVIAALFARENLARDLLIGVLGCALFQLLDLLFDHASNPLLASRAGWIAVSISAGVSEEVVFRGYLQKHLGPLWLAIPLQALLFGAVHPGARLEAALFGALLGLLAARLRGIRAGLFAHVLTDLSSALR